MFPLIHEISLTSTSHPNYVQKLSHEHLFLNSWFILKIITSHHTLAPISRYGIPSLLVVGVLPACRPTFQLLHVPNCSYLYPALKSPPRVKPTSCHLAEYWRNRLPSLLQIHNLVASKSYRKIKVECWTCLRNVGS